MLLRADSLSCFYTADANRFFPNVCVCERSSQASAQGYAMQIQGPASTQKTTGSEICATVRQYASYICIYTLWTWKPKKKRKKVAYNYIVII